MPLACAHLVSVAVLQWKSCARRLVALGVKVCTCLTFAFVETLSDQRHICACFEEGVCKLLRSRGHAFHDELLNAVGCSNAGSFVRDLCAH